MLSSSRLPISPQTRWFEVPCCVHGPCGALAGKLGNVKDQPDSISGSLRLFSLQKTTNKGDGFIQSLHRMQVPSQHQSTPASISGVVGDRLDRPENFDFLIVSRYDVRLLSPIISWPCYDQPIQVSAASMCEPVAWSRFKCIADHFWIVPKLFIPSYTELIGFRLNFSHYTSCSLPSLHFDSVFVSFLVGFLSSKK